MFLSSCLPPTTTTNLGVTQALAPDPLAVAKSMLEPTQTEDKATAASTAAPESNASASTVASFEAKNQEVAAVLCAEEDGAAPAQQMTLAELLYVFSMAGLQGWLQ